MADEHPLARMVRLDEEQGLYDTRNKISPLVTKEMVAVGLDLLSGYGLKMDDGRNEWLCELYQTMHALSPLPEQHTTVDAREAVARALAIADGKDPDAPAWVRFPGGRPEGICWRDQYAKKADAAIAAMPPTADAERVRVLEALVDDALRIFPVELAPRWRKRAAALRGDGR